MSSESVDWGSADGSGVNTDDIDWRKFTPLKKWVLVKADPRVKKTSGGIILTEALTGIEKVMEGTGRILQVGSEAAKDVEPGERICFRGFLKEAFHAAFKRDEDGCQIFMLRIEDVIAVIPDDVEMGAFSVKKAPTA